MLRTDAEVLSALDTWATKMANVPFKPADMLHVTFAPNPPVRTESQLHNRVASMGFSVFPRGSPPAPWAAVAGGQAGQWSVSLFWDTNTTIKATLQMQNRQSNLILKVKRNMAEVALLRRILPVLGAPSQITLRGDGNDKTDNVGKPKPLVPART